VAQSIDAKIDDSVATTGSVRWAGGDYGSVTDVNNANTMYWWFDR
jgi:hypothetical protein